MRHSIGRRAFLVTGSAAVATSLSGCFGGVPPLTYDLTAAAGAQALSRQTSRVVLITEPAAIETYDTDRIVVREPGNVLSYLPEAQWSGRLPSLLQTRMVQSFLDNDVPNISRPGDQLDVEIALASDVRAFEIDVRQGQEAVVTLSARLVDEYDRRIIATQAFTARTPVPELTPTTAVAALDTALRNVIEQIMVWTVRQV